MSPPRFQHGYAHDVFVSYTHTDDQPDAGRRWVTQFTNDFRARLEIVSGHTVDIWRDEEKLDAADRFNDTIAQAVGGSAVLVVVLSPSYFNSEYCQKERERFYEQARRDSKESVGGKARVVKVAKFRVGLERYPQDLRQLLEHRFYTEMPGSALCKEFHLSDDPDIRKRYDTKIDDVAQEVTGLLAALEPAGTAADAKGLVYLAETTSDVETQCDNLRRHLLQLGYDVQPKTELRLLPAREIRQFVTETIRKCRLAVHPVGAYYGYVPEGAEGKSIVQIQLELARADVRNGDLERIIWVPEGLNPTEVEDVQKKFLERVRTEFAGRGFEFLERPFRALASRVEDRLKAPPREANGAQMPSGIYLVCHNSDRALAKTVRSFLFNQRREVEWTPVSLGLADLTGNPEHEKLLCRNQVHLVLYGETDEAWIQDRIRELNASRQAGTAPVQAIYLANPPRPDKEEILVRDVALLEGYSPVTVADALRPLLDRLGLPGGMPPPAGGSSAGIRLSGGLS